MLDATDLVRVAVRHIALVDAVRLVPLSHFTCSNAFEIGAYNVIIAESLARQQECSCYRLERAREGQWRERGRGGADPVTRKASC